MRLLALICIVAVAVGALGGASPDAASVVNRLKSHEATYDDWPPILEAGAAAVPELKKLLADGRDAVRAAAAVLLYRLGETGTLDALDKLLESGDAAARAEAADALAAFTGGPAASGVGLAAWRAWWKANRQGVEAPSARGSLHGKVLGVDPSTGLVATNVGARHGARREMRLNVRRGGEAVCILEIVFATPKGSVGRIIPFSNRATPQPGDTCFSSSAKGE
ncbi:MAG TPA: HEAT repeat domain-containing protein [Planctomycetota bacterium]|nr:HEAT repeat domain-containing protein [Planctomycetota bacterium]HRR81432.1 HEAT repeat domain-containing protein [Planctomycetota bacterium]HRT95203.1 HEAT repeat domain-containing protein [Planctomycetota bacterium]